MDIIRKDKNYIIFNDKNTMVKPTEFEPIATDINKNND
jgi:hypothetical protein